MKILLMCFTLISVASISGFAYSCTINGNGSQITHIDNNTSDKKDKDNDSNSIVNDKVGTGQSGNIDVSKGGGEFNKLIIDKDYYLVEPILKELNFDNKIALYKITQDKIKNALHSNEPFKGLDVEILNSSNTKDGKLVLKLFGLYKDKNIDSTISIIGFVNKEYFNNISVGDYKLNLYNWFDNSLPTADELKQLNSNKYVEEIQKIKWDVFSKYIENANIYKEYFYSPLISLKQANKLGLEIEFGSKVENNKTSIKINVKNVKYRSYHYENNKWVQNKELENLNYNFSNYLNTVSIPSKNDALKMILENTIINDEILKKHYPSYFSSQALYSKIIGKDANNIDGIPFPKITNLINPPMELLKKVSNRYYGFALDNHLAVNIDSESVVANDIGGELNFNLIIYKDSYQSALNTMNVAKTGLKSLNNLLEESISNDIFLKKGNFDKKNTLAYKFAKKIKETYPNVIDDLQKNNMSSMYLDLSIFNQLKSTAIYSNFIDNNKFDINNKIFNEIEQKVFNIPINVVDMAGAGGVFIKQPGKIGDIERHSGMFVYKNNELFQIDQISYNIESTTNNLRISKNKSNNYMFSFDFSTTIHLKDQQIEQKSTMNLELLQQEWDNLLQSNKV